MKTFYKLVVFYFNLSFMTFLKFEGNQLQTSKVFLFFSFTHILIVYVLPFIIPNTYMVDNANFELFEMKSSSPFLTAMIHVSGVQSALVRVCCIIFMFRNHKKVLNLILQGLKTLRLCEILVNSKDYMEFESKLKLNFIILFLVGLSIKICNFHLASRFTFVGFLVNVMSQPFETSVFTFIQLAAMFLAYFLFLLKNLLLSYQKLKYEELNARMKSIAFLVETFNATLGFLFTLILVNITLSVTIEVS